MTFNQVVRGSNPRTLRNEKWRKSSDCKGFRHFFVIVKVTDLGGSNGFKMSYFHRDVVYLSYDQKFMAAFTAPTASSFSNSM